jgi:hypothetical protein
MPGSTIASLLVIGLLLGCALAAAYCVRSLRREARGLEIHAHADGTVHEHHRGGVPHDHPTVADRHERLVRRLFRESVS